MLAVILPYIPFSGLIRASRDCTEHSCMLNVREALKIDEGCPRGRVGKVAVFQRS